MKSPYPDPDAIFNTTEGMDFLLIWIGTGMGCLKLTSMPMMVTAILPAGLEKGWNASSSWTIDLAVPSHA